MTAALLIAAILSEVTATMSLRASDGFARKVFLAPIVGGYLLAFLFLALALDRGLAVGVAYGTWAASGVAIVAIASRFVFAEPLTKTMGAGIGLIAAGVLVVELSAR